MSIREIKETSNLKNSMGYTAQDILLRIPQDFKCLEMQVILMNCGIKIQNGEMNTPQDEALLTPNTNVLGHQEARHRRNILKHMGKQGMNPYPSIPAQNCSRNLANALLYSFASQP